MPFYTSTLTHRIHLTPSVYELTFVSEQPLSFTPGEFVSFLIEHQGKKYVRSYSIVSYDPNTSSFTLCIKHVQDGMISPLLEALPLHTPLKTKGPAGKFVLPDPLPQHLNFIATGTGIAPFIAMITYLATLNSPPTVHLLCGVRSPEEQLYPQLLEQLTTQHSWLNVIWIYSQASPHYGYVQDHLKYLTSSPTTHHFICGIPDMVKDVEHNLISSFNIPQQQITHEIYT